MSDEKRKSKNTHHNIIKGKTKQYEAYLQLLEIFKKRSHTIEKREQIEELQKEINQKLEKMQKFKIVEEAGLLDIIAKLRCLDIKLKDNSYHLKNVLDMYVSNLQRIEGYKDEELFDEDRKKRKKVIKELKKKIAKVEKWLIIDLKKESNPEILELERERKLKELGLL